MFQSSPGPKTGCHARTPRDMKKGGKVSILTRPEDRVPREKQMTINELIEVSILTRPEDRVPPGELGRSRQGRHVSILTRPEDRVPPVNGSSRTGGRCVSILTRPEDRVPRGPAYRHLAHVQGFNPHPARRPGATVHTHPQRSYAMFQSSPGPKTGCHRTYAHSKELRNVSILTRPEDRVPRLPALS